MPLPLRVVCCEGNVTTFTKLSTKLLTFRYNLSLIGYCLHSLENYLPTTILDSSLILHTSLVDHRHA